MKRTDWIIAGFLAVLILAVLSGFLIFWLQSQASSTGLAQQPIDERGSSVTSGITADDALVIANSAATQWQPDAQLVSASATIIRFEELADIYSGRTNWNMIYYSFNSSSLATFTVTQNGASLLNSKSIDIVPLTIDQSILTLNSGQAMTMAMANGGEVLFVGQAQRVAHLSLERKPEGRTEWQIAVQNETAGLNGIFRMDAATGELIEKSGLEN